MIRIPGDIDRYIMESKIDLIREKKSKKIAPVSSTMSERKTEQQHDFEKFSDSDLDNDSFSKIFLDEIRKLNNPKKM